MKKIFKSGLLTIAAIGLSLTLVQGGASAEEKIDGKCTITIDESKHTGDNNKFAEATGKCNKRVVGYYAGNQYHVMGGHDGTVVDGEKYNVTIMPGFYTYEVTVHASSQVKSLVAPKVTSVGSMDKKVTGTTEPKVQVAVKSGKTTLGKTTSDKNGKYTVSLKKAQKAGTKLTVTATKGKESKSKTIIVKYKDPVVKAVNSKSTNVTGTTESSAKVTVKVGSKVIGTATANKSGKYTVKIQKQKVGTKLSISAAKSGNTTKTKTVTVK